MLASDVNNPEFAGAFNPDSRLNVRFFRKPVQNEYETNLKGRPIFQDFDFVRIEIPGDTRTIIETYARDEHKRRFPMQWAAYQNGVDGPAQQGTPLSAWPLITASQIEEFRALKFYTVESLANASDQQINNIGMIGGMQPHALRAKAQAFLKAAQDTAYVNQQAEVITKLRQENEAAQQQWSRQFAEMQAQIQALTEAANKRGPGRPRKEESEA